MVEHREEPRKPSHQTAQEEIERPSVGVGEQIARVGDLYEPGGLQRGVVVEGWPYAAYTPKYKRQAYGDYQQGYVGLATHRRMIIFLPC